MCVRDESFSKARESECYPISSGFSFDKILPSYLGLTDLL